MAGRTMAFMERREAREIAAQDEILQVIYWLRGGQP